MSSETPTPAPAVKKDWPVLSPRQRRVLGVLVEKAKTTPDAYPMSINSVVTGSNQKSNRDPVMNLGDVDVEETLVSMQKPGLTTRITGTGRVERWRHNLYDAWEVDKVELAVLAELLLRGAQTEGELRTRASRMEEIEDLDALRAILAKLKERKLVVYVTPEGKRGTVVTHGFHAVAELEALKKIYTGRAEAEEGPTTTVFAPPPRAAVSEDKVALVENAIGEAKKEIQDLRSQVTALQVAVTGLTQELKGLKEALGS